jgi:hypothetical protein
MGIVQHRSLQNKICAPETKKLKVIEDKHKDVKIILKGQIYMRASTVLNFSQNDSQ